MSYQRVIPRDLFNEANLLKCYGQLYLNLERKAMEDCLKHFDDYAPFYVIQGSDGELSLFNVKLYINKEEVELYRPLNSRLPYPLQAIIDEEYVDVFNDDGTFSEEFNEFLEESRNV